MLNVTVPAYKARLTDFNTNNKKLQEAIAEAGPSVAPGLRAIYDSFQMLWCRQPGPTEIHVRTGKPGGNKEDSGPPGYFSMLDDAYFKLPDRTFNFSKSTQQSGPDVAATNAWKKMLAEGLEKEHWDDKVNAKSWPQTSDDAKAWGARWCARHADLLMRPEEFERKLVRITYHKCVCCLQLLTSG